MRRATPHPGLAISAAAFYARHHGITLGDCDIVRRGPGANGATFGLVQHESAALVGEAQYLPGEKPVNLYSAGLGLDFSVGRYLSLRPRRVASMR